MSKGIEKEPKPKNEQELKLVLPDIAHLVELESSSLNLEEAGKAKEVDSSRSQARRLGAAGLTLLTLFACAGEAKGQSRYIWQDLGRTLGHRGIENIFRGLEQQSEMRRREIEEMIRIQQRQREEWIRQQQREREIHIQSQQRELEAIQRERMAAIDDYRNGRIDRKKLDELLSICDREEARIRSRR